MIYRRTWQCNDGGSCQGMYLENGVISDQINRSTILSQGMWVTVTGSEPLMGLKLDVNNLINVPAWGQADGGRIWQFYVGPAQISNVLNGQTVAFTCYNATDVSGNAIFGLTQAEASQACVQIPKRLSDSSWKGNAGLLSSQITK